MFFRALRSFGHTLVGDPRPLIVHYHVTASCNFRCIFCNIWREGKKLYPNQVPARVIKKHVEQLADIGAVNIDFTGGEPLLRQELGELYGHAKDCDYLTTINTNGWFVEKRVRELHNNIDYAQVSLDSPCRSENDYIRGKRGAYDRALSAVKLFKDFSVPVTITCTLTKQTLSRLEGFSSLAQELSVGVNVNVVFPQPLEHTHEKTKVNDMVIDYQYCARKLNEAKHLPNLFISGNFIRILQKGGNRADKPICKSASVMATIAADGTMILPCFYHPEARFNLHKFHHVRNAWYSHLAWRIRENCGRYPFCEGCIARCYLTFSQIGMPRDFGLFCLLVQDYLVASRSVTG